MTVQTHNFEADTGKILNIVINSLYSDRDIFLRELLSNASDAIHKKKFLAQTQPQLLNDSADEICVHIDEKKKTVEIIDTGIGLSADDLVETLGTIARSGTSSFLDSISEAADNKDAAKTLIGKFGVGFYSAFMVAEKVVVTTKRLGKKIQTLGRVMVRRDIQLLPSIMTMSQVLLSNCSCAKMPKSISSQSVLST